MSDFPGSLYQPAFGAITSAAATQSMAAGSFTAAAVWPAANRAIYIPFRVETTVTAYQMAVEVGTQSGNLDIGIYDELGNRLVSSGSTAVAAAGIQAVNITDTVLTPGIYFMALCVDNITAAFTRSSGSAALLLEVQGVQQQAVGAVTLPDPATFANPASAYVPLIAVATTATI